MSKRNRLTFYLRANIHAFPHSFGKRVNISGTYCNCSRWGARTKRGRKENKKVIELTNLSAGWRHQSTRRKHSKNQGKRAEMRQERGGGGGGDPFIRSGNRNFREKLLIWDSNNISSRLVSRRMNEKCEPNVNENSSGARFDQKIGAQPFAP